MAGRASSGKEKEILEELLRGIGPFGCFSLSATVASMRGDKAAMWWRTKMMRKRRKEMKKRSLSKLELLEPIRVRMLSLLKGHQIYSSFVSID